MACSERPRDTVDSRKAFQSQGCTLRIVVVVEQLGARLARGRRQAARGLEGDGGDRGLLAGLASDGIARRGRLDFEE